MFERNRAEAQEYASVAVEIVVDDGAIVAGKLFISASRSVFEVLNSAALFVDFEPYEGERRFLAKASLKSVKLLAGAKPLNLAQKARDLDSFDPQAILGVQAGAPWDEVRSAYLSLAKIYHPDRFATAELPTEVAAYMSGMLRRINAAYSALEVAHQARRAMPVQRAIYTSAART